MSPDILDVWYEFLNKCYKSASQFIYSIFLLSAMESKTQNYLIKAVCGICNKLMRKDHLKRHYQTHIEELTRLQEFT